MTEQTPDHGAAQPEQPAQPTGPAYDVTPGQAPAPAGRRRGMVLGAVGAALALVVGGGAVWAVSTLSGGGTQPEELVPASALGFVDVDLDPAAGEKIDAARFLRSFPDLSDRVTEDGDLFEQLVRAAIESDTGTTVDYDRDIEPWAGRRAGVAMLPPEQGDDPDALVVIQVTDEDAARTSLRRLLDEGSASDEVAGLVVRDGYALIGSDQAATEAASRAAEQASLADDERYRGDLDVLGERGVATAWMDTAGLVRLGIDAAEDLPTDVAAAEKLADGVGRVASALRFEPDRVEVAMRVVGADPEQLGTGEHPSGDLVAGLPQGTVAALGVGDVPSMVDRAWTQVSEVVGVVGAAQVAEQAQSTLGVRLPDDLALLLGQSLVVALDVDAGAEEFHVALRERNDRAAEAKSLLDRLLADVRSELGVAELGEVTTTTTPDGLVLATGPEWAAQVAAPTATLADDPVFGEAVPDAADADSVLWVDLREIDRVVRETSAVDDVDDVLGVLGGLGASSRVDGSTVAVDLRLVLR